MGSISRPVTRTKQIDMSRDRLSIGWMTGSKDLLMWMQDHGHESLTRLSGWCAKRCHPLWLEERLVCVVRGGSCRAKSRNLVTL